MSCPCLYERNAGTENPQIPRPVRQVSRRTNDRAPLPGGVRRSSSSSHTSRRGSTRSMSMNMNMSMSMGMGIRRSESLEKTPNTSHGQTSALPRSILKHPTRRFPFEDPVAVQRATGLRFEVGKLSSEFTLAGDMVEVHGQRSGGRQARDSMVVVDEARTGARRRGLSEKESREALLGEGGTSLGEESD